MLITLALGIVFFGSCFALWYRISEKIPQVVAIHDEVITQRLHENSARLRIFLLHFKTFYKEEYYHNLFWNFLGKICYKLHIFVLKIDNALIGFLKKIRTRDGLAGLSVSEEDMHRQVAVEKVAETIKQTDSYWSALKNETTPPIQTPARTTAQLDDGVGQHRSGRPRKRHIEGVRPRVRNPQKSMMITGSQNEPI